MVRARGCSGRRADVRCVGRGTETSVRLAATCSRGGRPVAARFVRASRSKGGFIRKREEMGTFSSC
jgi:hypothetical protein